MLSLASVSLHFYSCSSSQLVYLDVEVDHHHKYQQSILTNTLEVKDVTFKFDCFFSTHLFDIFNNSCCRNIDIVLISSPLLDRGARHRNWNSWKFCLSDICLKQTLKHLYKFSFRRFSNISPGGEGSGSCLIEFSVGS